MPQTSPARPPAAAERTGTTPRDTDYTQEVRFGVVMYGGVSLAIYINGVASELFEMACATPRPGHALDDTGASATREVYRRLSWLAADGGLRARYAAALKHEAEQAGAQGRAPHDAWPAVRPSAGTAIACERARLVVDVISGTSAGGINGVFLAKALAGAERFDTLQDLWVREGDLGKLINDARSYDGLPPRLRLLRGEPRSLLNSDRMYLKLLQALQDMTPLPRAGSAVPAAGAAGSESPLAERVDLFVTTTDIEGAPVPLRLFDKVVLERRHRQAFHFRHPPPPEAAAGGQGGDFQAGSLPFLAFAARCTSSFPFAFEPMTLDAIRRLSGRTDLDAFDRFFNGLPADEVRAGHHVWRAFGDGGYLDNKPFSHAVEALSQRSGVLPLERKLLYVEPAPERLDPAQRPEAARQPDAVANAVAALTRIPLYETIREDLQAVLQRNRRIERVERMVQLAEVEVEQALQANADPFAAVAQAGGVVAPWQTLRLSHMVKYYGVGFLPYRRLRVYALSDTLADRLAAMWGVDAGSDHRYALRVLVRLWRERLYHEEGEGGRETVNAFLDQFDLPYRLRRQGLLLRKADQYARLLRRHLGAVRAQRELQAGGAPSELEAHLEAALARALLPEGTAPTPAPGEAAATAQADALQQVLHDEAWLQQALDVLRLLKSRLLAAQDALQRIEQNQGVAGATDPAARDEALRAELREVLRHLLGERGPDAPPLRLTLHDGRAWTFHAEHQGPQGRTLQERVLARAQRLFDLAEAADPAQPLTRLQRALHASLDRLRFKQRPQPEGVEDLTPANVAAGGAWRLLGRPVLRALPGTPARIDVAIGAAELPALPGDAGAQPDLDGTALLDSPAGTALRRLLSNYYLQFDSFDQTSFPLYYDTGTGEPATVEVVRVSPADATRLVDEAQRGEGKLAGTALANFGAFLDERWRRNDILWGRLDGAERLVHALLPGHDADSRVVREALIDQAHDAILRETLVPQGRQHLTDLVLQALQGLGPAPDGQADPAERLRALLQALRLGPGVQRDRLQALLASLLDPADLRRHVQQVRLAERRPEPQALLRNASRAVAVAGQVLQGVSRGPVAAVPGFSRWLARAGLVMQGAVALSLPGSLAQGWVSHAVKVLYGLLVLVLLAALALGNQELRSLALTVLGLVAAAHLLLLLLGDTMRERRRVLRTLVGLAAAGTVALALLGASGWARLGPVTLLCGPGAAASAAQGQATPACRAALVVAGWKQALLRRLGR